MTPARIARRVAPPPALVAALSALVLLAGWEAGARALAGTALVAGPVAVLGHLADHPGLHLRAVAVTGGAALAGFVIGNAVAVALAVASILVPRLAALIGGLALVVFCLPLVATGPILRVLWGPGPGPQVTIAAIAVLFTTYLSVMVGLRAAPAAWFDLVRSYGRGPLSALRHVRARAALPYLVAGLRIGAPAAFLGAMIGEFTGAERGLGVLTIRAMRSLDVEATWALAAQAAGVSLAASAAIGRAGAALAAGPPPLILAPLPAPPRPMQRALRLLRAAGSALVLAAAVVLIWWAAMEAAALDRFFAKRPGAVWDFLFTAPGAAASRATLFAAMAETAAVALPGYALGLAAGAGLAVLCVLLPAAQALVMPAAVALRAVPILMTAPLIVLALGRGSAGAVTVVAVMIFFPTLVACLHGLRQAPAPLLDLFHSYGAGRWRRLAGVELPAMLPAFFASARMAVPAAVLAATTAEWLATGRGTGALMAVAAATSGHAMLWSCVVALAGGALLAHAAVGGAERAVLARFAPEQLGR